MTQQTKSMAYLIAGLIFLSGLTSACDYYISACQTSGWVANSVYCLNANITDSSAPICMQPDANGVTLDCEGLTIDGDDSNSLVGIYNDYNNVTIKNCVLTDFTATAIAIANNANVYNSTIDNCTITSNSIGIIDGGWGIFNLSVTNCNVSDNTDSNIIFTVQVDNSLFENNTANNAGSAGYGVGIGMASPSSDNNRIINNTCNNNGVGSALGIGLGVMGDSILITNNTANNNAGASGYGIYVNVINSQIVDNTAQGNTKDFADDNTVDPNNNEVIRLNTTYGNMVSFTYYNVFVTGQVSSTPDPFGYTNISKYVLAEFAGAGSEWLNLNISYTDAETAGVMENTLAPWWDNIGTWTQYGGSNGVDTTNNYVWMQLTSPDLNRVYAPMGDSIDCGDTITSSVTLGANLTSCPGNGLIVGANDVTIDCRGYSITGSSSGSGVYLSGSANNAVVENCSISGFSDGVGTDSYIVFSVADSTLSGNTYGIRSQNAWSLTAANNRILDNNLGIYIAGTSVSNVDSNVFSNNAEGIVSANPVAITNNVFTSGTRALYLELESVPISNNVIASDTCVHLYNGAAPPLYSNTLTCGTYLITGDYWTDDITNTTFNSSQTSVNFPGAITIAAGRTIDTTNLNISFNYAYVDSATLTEFDTTANITFRNLLSQYSYKKSFVLSHPPGALTDYPVKINVYRSPGTDNGPDVYVDTNCRSDFNDLRFTNSAGEPLDYWIEDTGAGLVGTIWVEFDSIGTSDTTFYMYYGNPTATPQYATPLEAGEATFLFFDDFSGTFPGTKWWGDTSFGGIAGGILTFSTDSATRTIATAYGSSGDIAMRSRSQLSSAIVPGINILALSNPTFTQYSNLFHYTYAPSQSVWQTQQVAPATTIAYTDIGFGTYHLYDIVQVRSGTPTVRMFMDNAQVGSDTTTDVPDDTQYAGFQTQGQPQTMYSDWMLIRKYDLTDPTWGNWGTQEPNSLNSPAILRNGVICDQTTTPSCYNYTSMLAETVIFDVSGWSNYTIGEGETTTYGVNIMTNSTSSSVSTTQNAPYTITIGNNGSATNTYDLSINNPDGAATAILNYQTWLTGWDYGKQITINGSSSNLTDYQVPIDLTDAIYNNTGLVGSWHLNENTGTRAVDSSGSYNDGTLQNGPTWVTGKFGSGLSFNGGGQYISAANTNLPTGSNPKTATVWFKTSESLGTNEWRILFNYGTYTFNEMFAFAISSSADPDCSVANALSVSQYGDAICGNTSVNDGNWHLGAVVVNGNDYSLYVDGALQKTGTMTTNVVDSGVSYIGRDTGGSYFNGVIDEVRIYNRTLSALELSDLYNATKARLDYTDIRFANGTVQYSHWLESDKKAWVKIPYIPASSQSTMYLYYGNPSATSQSNGNDTFEFFDDFNGDDHTGWTDSNSIFTVASSLVSDYAPYTSDDNNLYTSYAFSGKRMVEAKSRHTGDISTQDSSLNAIDSSNYIWELGPCGPCGGAYIFYLGPSGWVSTGITAVQNQYYIAGIMIDNDANTADYYVDRTVVATGITSYGPYGPVNSVRLRTYFSGSAADWDWVLVRKYTASEPAFSSWGSEESGGTVSQITLAATESTNLTLLVGDSTPGVYNVTVTATDADRPAVTATTDVITTTIYQDDPPTVGLISPADLTSTTNTTITFIANVSDDFNLTNASLYTNISGSWELNKTWYAGEAGYDADQLAVYHMNEDDGATAFDESGNGNDGTIYGDTKLLLHFDENTSTTAYDVSPYGNNGTLEGDTTWTDGTSNSGLSFDGSGDYVTLSSVPVTGTSSFTISAWIKTSTTGARQQIVTYGSESLDQGVWFYISTDDYIHTDLSYDAGPSSNVTVTDGNWHHVVVVNNAGSFQIYVDGVASGSPQSKSPNIGATEAEIGRGLGTNEWYFSGVIDEIGVYSKALNESEILDQYNEGKAKFGDFVSGKYGNAVEFDGVDDYVQAPLVTSKTSDVSIAAWFKTNNYATPGQGIVYVGSDASGNGYGFFVNNEGSSDGSLKVLYGAIAWYDTGAYITDSDWHHGVLVIESDGTPSFYLDNSLIYDGSGGPPNTPTSYVEIGRNDYPAYRYFYGGIDDVVIYDRSLSAEDVAELYDANPTNKTVAFQVRNIPAGYYIWNVKAYDSAGQSAWAPANYTLREADAEFAGGSGTLEDPYRIATWTQLNNVRNYLSAYFILTGNLSDADGDYAGLGDSWVPIGNGSNPFIGNFNGNESAISNLSMDSSNPTWGGLFGYINGANISNLNIDAINLTAYGGVGALFGNSNGVISITNCHATITGTLYSTSMMGGVAGGLGGNAAGVGTTISNCSALIYGTIYGSAMMGGFAGGLLGTLSNGAVIVDSYSIIELGGSVYGSTYAGGLVGYDSDGIINNSYVDIKSEVYGNYAGGLLGYNYLNIYGTTSSSNVSVLDSATLSGTSGVGLIVGYDASGSYPNSFGTVYDTSYGNITFPDWDVSGTGNLTEFIYLQNNLASVDSVSQPGFNKSADITFYFSPANWLNGWAYRKGASISGSPDGDLTDYQVPINLTDTIYNNTGLAGSWHFSEGTGTLTADSSGNENDGTLTGDPTWTTGKFGNGLSFDGGDDYVDVGSNDALNPHYGDFSVTAWVKTTNAAQQRIFAKGTYGGGGTLGWALMDWCAWGNGTCGQAAFLVGLEDGEHVVGSCYSIADGNWHYLVGVADRTGNIDLYVDGNKIDSPCVIGAGQSIASQASVDLTHPCATCLGVSCSVYGDCNSRAEYLTGSIDEGAYYNRTLSASEISGLYNAAKARLDYADIRFTDVNGNLLEYWQESDKKAWAKVPSIPASGTSIYMYYGNENASSESNGNDTFIFFDDFNRADSSDPGPLWDESESSNYWSITDDQLQYNKNVFEGYTHNTIKTVGNVLSENTSLTFDHFWYDPCPDYEYTMITNGCIFEVESPCNGAGGQQSWDNIQQTYILADSVSQLVVNYDPFGFNSWISAEIIFLNNETRLVYKGNTYSYASSPISSSKIALSGREYSNCYSQRYYDNLKVRKRAVNEPVIGSFGSEETSGYASVFVNPVILHDGVLCDETTDPACYNLTPLNASTVIFNVSDWSNYTIGEGAPSNQMWQTFCGSISSSLVLATNVTSYSEFYDWGWADVGNIYIYNSNANINWKNLTALGRTTAGLPSTNDFVEVDTVLGTTSYSNNTNVTYSTDGSNPITTQTFTVYGRTINNVPIVNSYGTASFVTGILWDFKNDTNGEFDATDNEDLVFVTQISGSTLGLCGGIVDYEVRVPDTLDTYRTGLSTVDFAIEIF